MSQITERILDVPHMYIPDVIVRTTVFVIPEVTALIWYGYQDDTSKSPDEPCPGIATMLSDTLRSLEALLDYDCDPALMQRCIDFVYELTMPSCTARIPLYLTEEELSLFERAVDSLNNR
jgi:hypothetical protein